MNLINPPHPTCQPEILGFCGSLKDVTNMSINDRKDLQKLPQHLQKHVQMA